MVKAEEVLQGKRVLIVDDHAMNIFALESALTTLLDITVHSASSGSDALALLGENWCGFDFVLMDMAMPGMSGYEATQRIRMLEQGVANPLTIIAVTARAMKEDRQRCFAAGVTDYVAKPVDIYELIGVMAKHCEQGMGQS